MGTSCETFPMEYFTEPTLYKSSHQFSGQTTFIRLASKPTGFRFERTRRRANVEALVGEGFLSGNGWGRMCRSIFHPKATRDGNKYITSISPNVQAGLQDLGVHDVLVEPLHEVSVDTVSTTKAGDSLKIDKLAILTSKLEKEGIYCNSLVPGQYECVLCPKCGGGYKMNRSFSLFIREDLNMAMWHCFRDECGWRGYVLASNVQNTASSTSKIMGKKTRTEVTKLGTLLEEEFMGDSSFGAMTDKLNSKGRKVVTEKGLKLEKLCHELIGYFSERMISLPTLQRNGVMQRTFDNEIVIAFQYRRNRKLVGCKYRAIEKKFWQERRTESIFYGVDDIKEASEIIIVEGEIDKLSMEEAGYQNCISVPNGASLKVSKNKTLNEEEGLKPLYLLNCNEYLEQASRIILATDSDRPGAALAEELARHLGMERCWRVRWPRKNEFDFFKDANEVLVCLGPDALRELITNAEPWHWPTAQQLVKT